MFQLQRRFAFLLSISLAFAHTARPSPALAAADEPKPAAEKSIEGLWQGSLKTGAIELRVVFRVAKDGEGNLKATMDSPDQGAKGIPVDQITVEGENVRFESKKVMATFEGKMGGDGREIKGQFKQRGAVLPLDLKRLDKEPDDRRPQDPKKPYPYAEEEVTYENGEAGVKLAGTLTLPKSQRPSPAVLLITGSGSQDRDESLLGHKSFLVLADYLTRRGIVVLRVDDRGVGGSTGDPGAANTDDLTGDALVGVAYLKGRKEVNPRQIGLIGHSEGGLIAPLAATRSRDVAFIVMLAGTGVTGEEIIYRQGELIAKAQGAGEEQLAKSLEIQKLIFGILRETADATEAEKLVRDIVAEQLAKADAPTPEAKQTLQTQAEGQIKALLSPWIRYFLFYDPAPALTKVKCPVLALNGEKDLQVEPKQNLPPIEAALKEGGNGDFTLRELPGLNHLFQHCETGSPSEYGKIEETFAPDVLELIGDWIAERTN